MPDIVVSITDEEVIVLNSFYPSTEDGMQALTRRGLKSHAFQIIQESTSQKDPNKLSTAEIRTEISTLDTAGEIPTYAERYPDVS